MSKNSFSPQGQGIAYGAKLSWNPKIYGVIPGEQRDSAAREGDPG